MKKLKYQICYTLRNKIWPYKNSRLRHFYSLRGKFLLRRKSVSVFRNYYVKKKYGVMRKRSYMGRLNVTRKFILANKSMKWIVGRRRFLPYLPLNVKKRANRQHALSLQKKKYFKLFYNFKREKSLINIYKKQWLKKRDFKEEAFFKHLEGRIDMFVYRLRLLPTLYSTHQYINHFGVYINNKLVRNTNFILKVGDIVSLNNNHWNLFSDRLKHKLLMRSYGLKALKNRRIYTLKKSIDFIKKLYKSRIFYFKSIVLQEYKKNRLVFFHLYKLFVKILNKDTQKNNEELVLLFKLFIKEYLNFCKAYKNLFNGLKIYDKEEPENPKKKARNIAYILSKLNRNLNKSSTKNLRSDNQKRTFTTKVRKNNFFKKNKKKNSFNYQKSKTIFVKKKELHKNQVHKNDTYKLIKISLLLYKINSFFVRLKYTLLEQKHQKLSNISALELVDKQNFLHLKEEKLNELIDETRDYLEGREKLQKKLRNELYKKEKLVLLIDLRNLVLRIQNFSFDWILNLYSSHGGKTLKQRLKTLKRQNRSFYFKQAKRKGFWKKIIAKRKSMLVNIFSKPYLNEVISTNINYLLKDKFLKRSVFKNNMISNKISRALFKSVLLLIQSNKLESGLNFDVLEKNENLKEYIKNFLITEKKKLVLRKFKLMHKKKNKEVIKFIDNKLEVLKHYFTLINNDNFYSTLLKSFEQKNKVTKNKVKLKSKSFLIKKRSLSSVNNLKQSVKLRLFSSAKELKRIKYLVKMQRIKKQRSRLKKIHRPHWYIPSYIEFDFRTLRGALVYYPNQKDIVHPFLSNVNDIINFYKNKNL